MSRSESEAADIGIIGIPDNRRVTGFVATATRMGLSTRVLPWGALLDDDARWEALRGCARVRIDSAGEDAEVGERLMRLGGSAEAAPARGELGHLRDHHAGFCHALDRLAALKLPCVNAPASIQTMFDKLACHQLLSRGGIPRPDTALAPSSLPEFRARGRAKPSGQIFLKPRYGSSASGVCAYRWTPQREQLTAPIEIERRAGRVRLFNSLKVRTYRDAKDIDTILSRLLPEGMIAETWIPKASLDGMGFDLRVVVVADEARQVVLRQSPHPMTNLHLGNARGSLERFVREYGARALDRCTELAVAATRCFDDVLYAGVDVLLSTDERAYVLEVNAFGDLLPGVRHRGETTYEAILGAMCLI